MWSGLKNSPPRKLRHYTGSLSIKPFDFSKGSLAILTKTAQTKPPIFRGNALLVQSIRTSDEFLLSGPFETGKTFAALYLLDTLLRKYPRSRATIVRKVRATMDSTVLETWRAVLELCGGISVYGGEKPEFYTYANGSRVWIGGLDNPGKSLSGERDFIYVNQAEELEQADWETLSSRATGRSGRAPFGLLFGDCNPGAADHWILRRCEAGALRLLESTHRDNPTLYDDAGQLTARGSITMGKLDALTGVRKQRGRYGRWVGAEGAYYTQLDEDRHLVSYGQLPHGWPAWGALDYGLAHPLSFGIFTMDPAGRVILLGHHASHKWLVKQHVVAMDELLGRLGVRKQGFIIAAGHDCWSKGHDDTETIAEKFDKHGYTLEKANVSRVAGALALSERLGNPDCHPPVPETLYIDRRARAVFDTLARMVHDPHNAEDVLKVNADAEGRGGDDDFDMLRYGIMAAPTSGWDPAALAALSSGRKV